MGIQDDVYPLVWPKSKTNPGQLDKSFRGFPVFGPEVRIRKDIMRQLKARESHCLHLWKELPGKTKLFLLIAPIIQRNFGWPNDNYIPDDPLEILIFDDGDGMAIAEFVMDIEDQFGIVIPEDASFAKKTLLEFINFISDKQAKSFK